MDYDAYDAILHHIFKQTQGDAWFKSAEDNISSGVCIRVEPGVFRVFPYENRFLEPFESAVKVLNPEVAVKLRSAAVHAALGTRDERVMIIWSDRIDDIIEEAQAFDAKLIKLVWKARPGVSSTGLPHSPSVGGFASMNQSTASLGRVGQGSRLGHVHGLPQSVLDEVPQEPEKEKLASSHGEDGRDLEALKPAQRPTRIFAAIYNGISSGLAIFFVGNGVKTLVEEFALDGDFMRFILVVTVPLIFCVSLFFCMSLVNSVTFVIGPVAQYHQNSKYYSAIPPGPIAGGGPSLPYNDAASSIGGHGLKDTLDEGPLPHVTIQMPVYKESLEATIAPSVASLQKAMLTYARQGGTSSIFICDDGMQLIPAADRDARVAFYAAHDIGWVARPKHSNEPGGFKRAGRFKKASNMNYALKMSLRMEEILLQLQNDPNASPTPGVPVSPGMPGHGRTQSGYQSVGMHDEEKDAMMHGGAGGALGMPGIGIPTQLGLEERALGMAVMETNGQAWAAGGKALRMGEVVLIVDSDTLVPEDCLRDAARELHESPEVAIIQHESDVMQVAHHYFENGIAYFTRRINHAISVACANGEVAPFVGHNAFLRWTAMQDAAFIDAADGQRKFWSEEHVSEDFDMALRLQMKGYIIRWATYSKGGFKEGVSLTCDDELNRWMKYSYGCNELLFNPLYQWFYKGPVTKRMHQFVWSPVPIHYKLSVLAYMFSYYGIAAALTLSVINYIILGWALPIDGYYLHSWEIWIATSVVFLGAGNVGMSVLEYRLGKTPLITAFWLNLKWLPFFFFFFGGMSLHLTGSILAHLFKYNIQWGATIKEVEISNFFMEVPRILKRFWATYVICWTMVAGMIILSTSLVPIAWRIDNSAWAAIFPLAVQVGCHILYPIVLNPWLLLFSY
ncbi:hypothetical protein EXIGLDRAFT_775927 [Exidia glandulosa HHB12029]|uniref:Uncharacterized protein n=1 Tax=Exidia glandulosa HHB12029 TaxID=1314781 RepID=A0A165DPF8_EXIGL|nr:hypothetical protein EXIGLDRAFT_775927 [Exidia glandulosa HHB12029]